MSRPHKTPDPGSPGRVSLSALHGRTIAVQLELKGGAGVLYGRGVYEHDDELGQVLRIEFAADPSSEILLVEKVWDGEVLSGEATGCDYLIRLCLPSQSA
jgi:hypothetical protein